MGVRSLLVVAVVAFVLGVSSSLLVRDAHAQALPFASTMYVPSDGLAFRSFDGHVIARLTYDTHGGVFEVYNEREQVAARVRSDATGHVVTTPTLSPTKPPASSDDVGF